MTPLTARPHYESPSVESVPTQSTTEAYNSRRQYLAALHARSQLPAGFHVATSETHFLPPELPPDAKPQTIRLSLILLEEPTDAIAAVTTRNLIVGAPVTLLRETLAAGHPVQGVVINNRVANVFAPDGHARAEAVLAAVGAAAGVDPQRLLAASTGVIGWRLPSDELCSAAPTLVGELGSASAVDLASAIMTTDAYPKLRSARTRSGHRVVGIAKGAGMIEPNMGTMLAFLLTDAPASRDQLQKILDDAVSRSFNSVSVDGDQSTSDIAVLLSSSPSDASADPDLAAAVAEVCEALAHDLVRNGEGTHHVMRIRARGVAEPIALARAVGNSPLVKTTIFGNDPNVGRILAAAGDHLGNRGVATGALGVAIGGRQLVVDGQLQLDPQLERDLHAYLVAAGFDTADGYPPHHRTVDIDLEFHDEIGAVAAHADHWPARVYAADLSYDYVRENADYRS